MKTLAEIILSLLLMPILLPLLFITAGFAITWDAVASLRPRREPIVYPLDHVIERTTFTVTIASPRSPCHGDLLQVGHNTFQELRNIEKQSKGVYKARLV